MTDLKRYRIMEFDRDLGIDSGGQIISTFNDLTIAKTKFCEACEARKDYQVFQLFDKNKEL